MNKTLITSAALSVLAIAAAGTAHAQSTVTLYGIADVSVGRTEFTNGTSVTGLGSSGITSRGPRFGMRGTEDLGGGMKASFQLEAGYNLQDGVTSANSQLFNRAAWAGVEGGFGSIRLGRQDSLTRMLANANLSDITGETELSTIDTTGSGTSARPLIFNFGSRLNNTLRYTSQNMAGLQVTVQSALGNKQTASTNGLMGIYGSGPLRVGLVYEYQDGQGVNALGRYNQATSIGVSYKLPMATLMAAYQNVDKFLISTSTTGVGTFGENNTTTLAALIPVGKSTEVRVQGSMATRKQAGASLDYTKIGASVRYALSRRTYVYGYALDRDADAVAASATIRTSDIGFGISHSF